MFVVAKGLDGSRWYGGRPRPSHTVLDEDPASPLPRKGHSSPLFSAHVYCGQTVAPLSYCWPPQHHTTTVFRPFSGTTWEPMPEEKFWTLWCMGRLTEADTPTIRLGATPSGLTRAHLQHPPFLQAGCPSYRPTNSVKALKATSAFGLWS